jgi:hypothetical protein
VILEIYALKKCFSFPKKYGLVMIYLSRLPVNLTLVILAALISLVYKSGKNIHGSKGEFVAQ